MMTPPDKIEPVTLTGQYVQLEPLMENHLEDLWTVADDPELWRYMPFDVSTREAFVRHSRVTIAAADTGGTLAFATRDLESDSLVGGTSYSNFVGAHRRVEVGATWLTRRRQRTAINTEAKILILGHAFEELNCNRVEFKTDALNLRSRTALERLGAVEEGTLRHHMVMRDGRLRDSTYYSILRSEWPTVRRHLEQRLNAHVNR